MPDPRSNRDAWREFRFKVSEKDSIEFIEWYGVLAALAAGSVEPLTDRQRQFVVEIRTQRPTFKASSWWCTWKNCVEKVERRKRSGVPLEGEDLKRYLRALERPTDQPDDIDSYR